MVDLKQEIFRFLFNNPGKKFTFFEIRKNVGRPYRQILFWWLKYFIHRGWVRKKRDYTLKEKNSKYRYYFNPRLKRKSNIEYYKKAGWIEEEDAL